MTTRQPPADREVPEGYELVAEPDPEWRLVEGKRCRMQEGPSHRACPEPAVAEFDRGTLCRKRKPDYWAYCPAHLYGRWVEGGKVMRWVLREVQPAAGRDVTATPESENHP